MMKSAVGGGDKGPRFHQDQAGTSLRDRKFSSVISEEVGRLSSFVFRQWQPHVVVRVHIHTHTYIHTYRG